MNDHDKQLARILVARYDWGWYGVTGEQLLSPDSQTVCSAREAARIEGLDLGEDQDAQSVPA